LEPVSPPPLPPPPGAPATGDVIALNKHACPACGGQAEWNPTQQKLSCPFCGTESPYRVDRRTGQVQELDLAATLRELPDEERGWQTERRSVQCTSCRAVMVFEPSRVGQNCEFCGSPALVDYQAIKAPISPQGVLPFRIDAARVRGDMRRWWRSKWFAPSRLSATALVDTLKSLYIPYWTFDARAHCPWEAEAGHYYYVPVQGHDAKGRPIVRQERRVRWEPAAGVVDHAFDDESVPGTQGLPLDLLKAIEPFPTREAEAYDTAFLSGHVVEHYQVVLIEASQRAQDQMHATLEALCGQQVPGDTFRNLRIHPAYDGRTFKHVLVPVWLLAYTYGGKLFQVVVNGVTGKIAGRHPYSVWKIVGAIAVALVIVAMLAMMNAGFE
jgi:predicted RNA-binding Zn-ribbon protein involved in translation (DUF1610 family)